MIELRASMLWSTPIIEAKNPEHEKIKAAVAEYARDIERRAAQPIESGVTPLKKAGLYESKFDFFKAGVPEIQSLRQFCGETLTRAVAQLFQRANPGQKMPERIAVDMHESWVHVTRDGGYHESHNHPNCSWCGIYYLDIGDCTFDPPNGVNRFFAPVDIGYEDFGTMAYPQKPITITPEDGKLVLFPHYVQHWAVPYRGQRERIIVSFNARVFPAQ